MKKLFTLIILFAVALSSKAFAEITIGTGNYSADIYGFVRTDVFTDSRNNFESREGHFLLLPKPEITGATSKDLNENFQFNILSVETRAGIALHGPEVLGAKTSGLIEGEFFGTTDNDANGFRLRHAYVDADWECTSLRVGQYWHPLFDADFMPGTVSFNTGAPFQPFSRVPQIKLTERFCYGMSAYAAINSTRDFSSYGPSGYSNEYLRNSGVPEMNAGFKYSGKNFSCGINGEYKIISPRIEFTNLLNGLRTSTGEKVNSFAANLYLKFNYGLLTAKAMGMYGQNINDLEMISGYAVKEIKKNSEWTYQPFGCVSTWIDLSYGNETQFGIFAGWTKNTGTADNTSSTYFSRYYSNKLDVESAYRMAPRIVFNVGTFSFCSELEYTAATYGSYDNTDKNSLHNKNTVGNIRALIAVILKF